MKKMILTLICLAQTSFVVPNDYLFVNLHDYGCGMFSVLGYVVGVLSEYERNPYAGLEVDFENCGLYYEPAVGSNWWNYYFEPIRMGSSDGANVKRFNMDEYCHFSYFSENHLNRHQNYDLIQKYVRIRQPIQNKIDQYVENQFSGYHVIGVHYRGTDKSVEAPTVPHYQVIDCIRNYINQNQIQNYRIFIASDEQEIVNQLLYAFGEDAVVGYSTQRSNNGAPLHFNNASHSFHGEEALIDCVLLSKASVLIRTSSNLSRWSSYFNPNIPVIELNHRY